MSDEKPVIERDQRFEIQMALLDYNDQWVPMGSMSIETALIIPDRKAMLREQVEEFGHAFRLVKIETVVTLIETELP